MSVGESGEKVSSLTTVFASEAFSIETVKRAAYVFSGKASFDFRSEGDEISVRLDFVEALPRDEARRLEFDFRNEVLDQSLRKSIADETRSEEHTSELQSLMRISYAVFCLQKKKK